MGIFSVKAFTGGMNNVLHPSLLQENTAIELVDAELYNGKIRSIHLPYKLKQTNSISLGHYGNRNRSLVKWNNRTYWSSNNATSAPYYGGDKEDYLGIPYPSNQPELSIVIPVNLSTIGFREDNETVSAGDYRKYIGKDGFILICKTAGKTNGSVPVWPSHVNSGHSILHDGETVEWLIYTCADKGSSSGLTGEYKYCLTFVDKHGWESAPGAEDSPLWVTITLDNQLCAIRSPEFPPHVKYAKVYRTVSGGGDFFNVGEIHENGGVFTDEMTDSDAGLMNPLETTDNYPPPDRGRYLTEYGGVFFLAVRDRLYFSLRGNPHAWPTTNFLGFTDNLTGMVAEQTGLLVFTHNNTYHITGVGDEDSITKYNVPGNQGCVNSRTIASLNNTPIWVSNDGLCMWNGEKTIIISQRRIDLNNLIFQYAVSANDSYYLFHKKGAVIYDLRNGSYNAEIGIRTGIFHKLSFTCEYAWYNTDSDAMFIERGNQFFLFGSGERGRFFYKSPNIGGTELETHKFFELLLTHIGEIEVEVQLEGVMKFRLSLIGDGRKQRIKLPWLVGKYLNVLIEGSGELTEYAVLYK